MVLLGCFGMVNPGSLKAEDGYTVDPKRSFVKVSVHYAVIQTMRGKFTDFQGTIHFDPHRRKGNSVNIALKTKSITTGNKVWDRLIRSRRLLNAPKYPLISFKSHSVKKVKNGYSLIATVTMHGVTQGLLQNTPNRRNWAEALIEKIFRIFRKRPFRNSPQLPHK